MKRTYVVCLVVLLVAAVALAKPGSNSSSADQIAGMGWIAGDWEGPHGGGRFHSYYSTPEGGRVMSYSVLTKAEKRVYFEFEVFERQGDKVIFQPFPGGKKAVALTLKECDSKKRKMVFENPQKDYPTRVVYQRMADDRLVITLSDPHHHSNKTDTYDMKRQ